MTRYVCTKKRNEWGIESRRINESGDNKRGKMITKNSRRLSSSRSTICGNQVNSPGNSGDPFNSKQQWWYRIERKFASRCR
mmetsp:Transcript_16697/g.32429  ORF Transcript_16697/g.32429 Transcript_16697/m.32429 type:complete len:81 (+) Transcript_16697:2793-3035(+)